MFEPRIHTHWLFYVYDSKDPINPDVYFGLVHVDVVAEDYDHAYQLAQKRRPRTGASAGWDLKMVSDHLPGHCKV